MHHLRSVRAVREANIFDQLEPKAQGHFVINSKPEYLSLFYIVLNCAKRKSYHYDCHLTSRIMLT